MESNETPRRRRRANTGYVEVHDERSGALASLDITHGMGGWALDPGRMIYAEPHPVTNALLVDSAVGDLLERWAAWRDAPDSWVHLRAIMRPGDLSLLASKTLAQIPGTAAYGFACAVRAWVGFDPAWHYWPSSDRERRFVEATLADLGMHMRMRPSGYFGTEPSP